MRLPSSIEVLRALESRWLLVLSFICGIFLIPAFLGPDFVIVGILLFLVAVLLRSMQFSTRLEDQRGMRWARRECIQCGYDLRANDDRCPECGATPPDARDEAALRREGFIQRQNRL